MKSELAVEMVNVSKSFKVREQKINTIKEYIFHFRKLSKIHTVRALNNINFSVNKGEFFGVIGHNGSGKSTLLKLILGAMKPDKGSIIKTQGKIMRLSLGIGFDKNLSARDNIYVNGSIFGLTFKKIGNIFDEIIEFAELEDFVDTPIKFYSSGMNMRLAFAISIHAESDILLMDEFFGGVGDESFKEKSDKVFTEQIIKNKTIVFVSHGMAQIEEHCNRVLLLNNGNQIALGTPDEVIPIYKEHYLSRKKKKK